jgi:hypothetical protein
VQPEIQQRKHRLIDAISIDSHIQLRFTRVPNPCGPRAPNPLPRGEREPTEVADSSLTQTSKRNSLLNDAGY